jgi:hypothetical protein
VCARSSLLALCRRDRLDGGLAALAGDAAAAAVAYFLGFANTCMAVSALGTFAGYYLVNALPMPLAAGLLCLTPIFFLVSLAAGIRHRGDVAAMVLGLRWRRSATA